MSTGWKLSGRRRVFVGDPDVLDALWEADQPDTERERRTQRTPHAGAGRGWLTDEQRERIVELREKGRAITQIAELVGTSRETVRRTLHAAGVDLTPALQPCGTPAAYRRHLSAKEVPCDTCTRASTDANIAYRRGFGGTTGDGSQRWPFATDLRNVGPVRRRRTRLTDEQDAQAAQMREDGASWSQIARALGCHTATARDAAQRGRTQARSDAA